MGEAESIGVAVSRRIWLAADDLEARATAKAYGAKVIGTAGILLQGRFSNKMTLGELEVSILDLSGILWISPSVITEVLRRAKE